MDPGAPIDAGRALRFARWAALATGGAVALVFACTSSPITPLGPASADASPDDASSEEHLEASVEDAAREAERALDAEPPSQLFGDATVFFVDGALIEGGAGSVDVGEVVPIAPSDGGPFALLDAPFFCGASACAPSTHYCLHVLPEGGLSPEGGGDLSDKCLPLPAACAASPSCACLEGRVACEAGVEGEGCVEGAGVEVSCPTY